MKMKNEYNAPLVEFISISTETNFAQSTPPNKFDGEAEYYDFLDEQGWA